MEGAKEYKKNAQKDTNISATEPNNNLKSEELACLDAIELVELKTNQAFVEESNKLTAMIENVDIANIDTGLDAINAIQNYEVQSPNRTESITLRMLESSESQDSDKDENSTKNENEDFEKQNCSQPYPNNLDNVNDAFYNFFVKHLDYKFFAVSLAIYVLLGIFIFVYKFDTMNKFCNDIVLHQLYIGVSIGIFVLGVLSRLLKPKKFWLSISCSSLNIFTIVYLIHIILAINSGLFSKEKYQDPENYVCEFNHFQHEIVKKKQ